MMDRVHKPTNPLDSNGKVVLTLKNVPRSEEVQIYGFLGELSASPLCGLVVRVPGYRSRGSGSIPGATRFSEK
jgi:hypothetical protein